MHYLQVFNFGMNEWPYKRGIAQLFNHGVVHGLKLSERHTTAICAACVQGKAHRAPFPKIQSSERVTDLLDRVHSDVCGPIEAPSIGRSRYFVTFIDEHSNWVTIFVLKHKSEVVGSFLEYEKYAERQTGKKIRILRSDRGGEYLSNSLTSYFKNQGIVHELTPSYTPHQNGLAERFNRTSLEFVRYIMPHMNVQKR